MAEERLYCMNCEKTEAEAKLVPYLHRFITQAGYPNYRLVHLCEECFKTLKEKGEIDV
jgi:hypothetical protein